MRSETHRALRFLVVGLLSTGLYFALLIALRPAIPSTALLAAVCYSLSMVFNFLAQGLWTFQHHGLSGQTLVRYGIMQGGAMCLNSAAMVALVDWLGAPLVASQILVTGGITVCVYLVSKRWVYR